MSVPYDPTRQTYTNDLGRADVEADKERRTKVELERVRDTLMLEQREDMARARKHLMRRASRLAICFAERRERAHLAGPNTDYLRQNAKQFRNFGQLMDLVRDIAELAL